MNRSGNESGRLGEELTAYYLKKSGYEILCRNYRIRGGEIDIIAAKDGVIAFTEVRTRDINALAAGAETVGNRKRGLIIKTAREYLYRNPCGMQPRFDVAEVTVRDGRAVRFRYFDNAFWAEDDHVL
ncbi:MAG: YraN family protein [Ruminococcus sp.]|nr:YraN family protein [Ruminococcus sp.]